jgi:hypothetical protein
MYYLKGVSESSLKEYKYSYSFQQDIRIWGVYFLMRFLTRKAFGGFIY